jgi:hypothetical protein
VLKAIEGAVFFDRGDDVSAGAENPGNHPAQGNNRYVAGHNNQEHRPAGNDNSGSHIDSIDSKLQGMKWVKYSNDDKYAPSDHVMLKVNVPKPTKVYVNVVEKIQYERDEVTNKFKENVATGEKIRIYPAHYGAEWAKGWHQETENTGVKFTSSFEVRGTSYDTTDGNGLRLEHFQDVLTTAGGVQLLPLEKVPQENCAAAEGPWSTIPTIVTEEFAGKVYSKVFPAGEIMLRGNGGKDGSYLVFLEEQECWQGTESRWAGPPKKEELVGPLDD